ncbi:MAG: glycosyltransferase family 39 protein [Candidatus Omnitrophica bacterium]|nr:glycosyltransferase family 39 protein [Candidatus Omnitrophota bacterium]
MKMRRLSIDPFLLLIVGFATVFLLANLGNGRLWQDEAETAVLGKNILRFGYPKAFDGVNWVNPAMPVRAGEAWTYHTWLSMYAAAASFFLFGTTTEAARLPFALMGVASVWLMYLLAKRAGPDKQFVRWSTFSLVLCVPFVLHMRQCRYYAPAVLFTLWTLLAYLRFLEGCRQSRLELFCALTLLFHSSHGVFIPVMAALLIHFFLHRPAAQPAKKIIPLLSWLAVTTVPWIFYLDSAQHHRGTIDWREVSRHLQFYFRQINKFVFPVIFWGAAALLWRKRFRGLFGAAGSDSRRFWQLQGWLAAAGLLFLIFMPEQRHFRYLVFLLPTFVLLQSALWLRVVRSNALIGVPLALLLLMTDALHHSGLSVLAAQIPAVRQQLSSPDTRIRSFPLELIGELTHPYRGPVDAVVELLRAKGKSGETVKTPYSDHPLIFYTELKVEPLRSTEDFMKETFPEWIVLKKDWIPENFRQTPYYRKLQERYGELLLDAPDIPWQNRPDPGYHRFRTDRNVPRITVLRRKD